MCKFTHLVRVLQMATTPWRRAWLLLFVISFACRKETPGANKRMVEYVCRVDIKDAGLTTPHFIVKESCPQCLLYMFSTVCCSHVNLGNDCKQNILEKSMVLMSFIPKQIFFTNKSQLMFTVEQHRQLNPQKNAYVAKMQEKALRW